LSGGGAVGFEECGNDGAGGGDVCGFEETVGVSVVSGGFVRLENELLGPWDELIWASMMIKVESADETVDGVAPVSSRNDFALCSPMLEERAEVGILVKYQYAMGEVDGHMLFRQRTQETEARDFM
jgi:hypothetical protein